MRRKILTITGLLIAITLATPTATLIPQVQAKKCSLCPDSGQFEDLPLIDTWSKIENAIMNSPKVDQILSQLSSYPAFN